MQTQKLKKVENGWEWKDGHWFREVGDGLEKLTCYNGTWASHWDWKKVEGHEGLRLSVNETEAKSQVAALEKPVKAGVYQI